jgi:DNA-binding CsgD family transcriptional regulator
MNGPRLRVPLTPRERAIANLVGDNLSYRQIGLRLERETGRKLSPHTVRSYVVRMATKIEFPNGRTVEPRMAVYSLIIFERIVHPELSAS